MKLRETIDLPGVASFELDRAAGTIEISDFHNLVFTPAQLAYVLQQYGEFTVKVDPTKKFGALWGITDAG